MYILLDLITSRNFIVGLEIKSGAKQGNTFETRQAVPIPTDILVDIYSLILYNHDRISE